jgi:hypothetical protein
MKLAALFTAFNGLELLPAAVDNIAPHVDEIIICYQTVSNKGEHRPSVADEVRRIKGVHIIEFTPDLTRSTKANERTKLQLRIDYARKLGCTHYIGMACDHFYHGMDVEWAKQQVRTKGYDVTFTRMFTYYKRPTWRIDPIEDYLCPFITEIKPSTAVGIVPSYHAHVDPSTMVTDTERPHVFDEVMLHHYSMIRLDIRDKFRNAAASIRWKPEQVAAFIAEFEGAKLGDSISYFKGRRLVSAPDLFNLTQ